LLPLSLLSLLSCVPHLSLPYFLSLPFCCHSPASLPCFLSPAHLPPCSSILGRKGRAWLWPDKVITCRMLDTQSGGRAAFAAPCIGGNGRKGGEGNPETWAPSVASCVFGEGSQGSVSGSYPVRRRGGVQGEQWEKGCATLNYQSFHLVFGFWTVPSGIVSPHCYAW
jgi:hypothetical protein